MVYKSIGYSFSCIIMTFLSSRLCNELILFILFQSLVDHDLQLLNRDHSAQEAMRFGLILIMQIVSSSFVFLCIMLPYY